MLESLSRALSRVSFFSLGFYNESGVFSCCINQHIFIMTCGVVVMFFSSFDIFFKHEIILLFIHTSLLWSNFKILVGIKLLNIFIKFSAKIFVFSLISLFWKAKAQLRRKISLCMTSTFSFNKLVVVVYRSSVYRIWYYGNIYRKLIVPFQWLSNLYMKKKLNQCTLKRRLQNE